MADVASRYDVQDPEPDAETGMPGQIYRTSAENLIPIPPRGERLIQYPVGTRVLARYPETTFFYPALVENLKEHEVYLLCFEGDGDRTAEVDARYVLNG